ncbi:MAG: DegT/DnrJ/EryC1/StrS family aminotransferase [Acidobacteriota bacterium]
MKERPAIEGGQPVRRSLLPFHRPLLGRQEEAAVLAVLRSGWLTRGEKTTELETRLKQYTGAGYVLALNSCTAALELSLVLAGIGPDDEVIVPAMTFVATANVVAHRFARPILVDVQPDTLNIDPQAVEAALTPRTRALIPVDLAGHPADMAELRALADRHHLVMIEDAAHALEARYHGNGIGALADYACLSFYANKNITTGEGGALLMKDDPDGRAATLSLHGLSRHAWSRFGANGFSHYDVTEAGYKWNMFDLQAALGLAQMDRLEKMHHLRLQRVRRYVERLQGHAGLELPRTRPNVEHAWHLFMVKLNLERLRVDRDHVLKALRAEGIGAVVHYRPLPQLAYYRRLGFDPAAFPVADAAGNRLLSLPLFPAMSLAEVDDAVTALNRILDFYQT